MNEYHLYRFRHLFKGDEHVGKYDAATRTLRLRQEFATLKDEARAHMRREGVAIAAVLAGDECPEATPPLRSFPPEVVAQMGEWGVRTPEVVAYAQEHFTRAEFLRCYGDYPEYVGKKTQDDKTQDAREETPATAKPSSSERMRKLNEARRGKMIPTL